MSLKIPIGYLIVFFLKSAQKRASFRVEKYTIHSSLIPAVGGQLEPILGVIGRRQFDALDIPYINDRSSECVFISPFANVSLKAVVRSTKIMQSFQMQVK